MKHILLLLTLLLGATTLQAAGNVPTLQLDSVVADVVYPGKTKDVFSVDETGRQRVKRVYQWNTATREWVGYEMVEQTVNDKGLVVDETYSQWSFGSNNWAKVSRTTNAYSMLGNITQHVGYSWNGQTWEKSTKIEVVYNENGRQTQQVLFTWNEQTADWAFFIKTELAYNKNNQLTSDCRYFWSSSSNQWASFYEGTTRYDEQGREIESTTINQNMFSGQWQSKMVSTTTYNDTLSSTTTTGYSWDKSTSQWKPITKTEKQFDTKGLPTAISYYYWDNEQNPYLQKQEYYTYNQRGYITSYVFYIDNNFDGFLEGVKTENEYNENNRKIRSLESYQNSFEGNWYLQNETQFAYDAYGNTISEMSYDLSWADYEKVGRKKKLITYDYTHQVNELCAYSNEVETSYGGQLPTSCTEYAWDLENNDWQTVPVNTTQYHYSPYTATAPPEINNKLEVFLDPVGNLLYVDDKEVSLLGTSREKPVRVYNVSGLLHISSGARIINVSELPKGLYLVNVNGQTRRVMKR